MPVFRVYVSRGFLGSTRLLSRYRLLTAWVTRSSSRPGSNGSKGSKEKELSLPSFVHRGGEGPGIDYANAKGRAEVREVAFITKANIV